jgi:hypothetical protein
VEYLQGFLKWQIGRLEFLLGEGSSKIGLAV